MIQVNGRFYNPRLITDFEEILKPPTQTVSQNRDTRVSFVGGRSVVLKNISPYELADLISESENYRSVNLASEA